MNAKMAFPSPLFLAPRLRRPPLILRATGPTTAADDNKEEEQQQQQQQQKQPPPIAVGDANNDTTKSPRNTVNIKYRVRSRNQARQRKAAAAAPPPPPPPPKKEWDAMTVGEKAVELYVGEKGLLFWLNKLAYASIFIVIGGWILFRFVGPSLGLYQLDSEPLSPSSIFKGSP